MLSGNPITAVVGLGSMSDDTCIPNMAHAHFPDFLQGSGREIIQLSAAILVNRTVLLSGGIAIAVKSRKDLIDNDFTRCHGQRPLC